MIGRRLLVKTAISQDAGSVAYSGIEWQARLAVGATGNIAPGAHAEVVAVDGSLLLVKAL